MRPRRSESRISRRLEGRTPLHRSAVATTPLPTAEAGDVLRYPPRMMGSASGREFAPFRIWHITPRGMNGVNMQIAPGLSPEACTAHKPERQPWAPRPAVWTPQYPGASRESLHARHIQRSRASPEKAVAGDGSMLYVCNRTVGRSVQYRGRQLVLNVTRRFLSTRWEAVATLDGDGANRGRIPPLIGPQFAAAEHGWIGATMRRVIGDLAHSRRMA